MIGGGEARFNRRRARVMEPIDPGCGVERQGIRKAKYTGIDALIASR